MTDAAIPLDSIVRVYLCDDHEIVLEGLRSLLARSGEIDVVGTGTSSEAVLRDADPESVDVVVLDYRLPGTEGDDVCRQLVERGLRVLILTSYLEEDVVRRCLRAGAHGYVVKDVAQLELCQAIRRVAAGDGFIDPKVAGRVLSWVRNREPERGANSLTPRETEILRLMAEGLSNREISRRIHLSESTVKGYVTQILAKMGVHHRLEAVTDALRRGLV